MEAISKLGEKTVRTFPILGHSAIRNEISSYLVGFSCNDVSEYNNGIFTVYFSDIDGTIAKLRITAKEVILEKNSEYYFERVTIKKSLTGLKSVCRRLEKRQNGAFVEETKKTFKKFINYPKVLLSSISDDTYTIDDGCLRYFDIDRSKCTPKQLLRKLFATKVDGKSLLSEVAIHNSDAFFDYNVGFPRCDEVLVCVNGEERTEYSDVPVDENILSRIFDLYRGRITTQNLADIDRIRRNEIPSDAFDLKALLGMSREEVAEVGYPVSDFGEKIKRFQILNYLRKRYNSLFSIRESWGEITRDSILRVVEDTRNKITDSFNERKR